MKREEILAAYLDAARPEDRRAIEVEYPELALELRLLAAVAHRVRSSAGEMGDEFRFRRSLQLPAAGDNRIGAARSAAIGAGVFASAWFLAGEAAQMMQLLAMAGWLSIWLVRFSPRRVSVSREARA